MNPPAEFSEEHDRGMEEKEEDGLMVFGVSSFAGIVIVAIVGVGVVYLLR